MDTSIAATDYNVFQYMVSHGSSWISKESIMAYSKLLVSSYLTLQENVREVIKIEEKSPISNDDPPFSGATEDTKDVCTFDGEESIAYKSEICSKTRPMLHERLHKTEKSYKCKKCHQQFKMKKYLKQHQTIH